MRNISAYDLALELETAPQNIYYHLKRQEIALTFKERLARAGRNVFGVTIKSFDKSDDSELVACRKEVQHLRETLAHKEETIKGKDETIRAKDETIRALQGRLSN